MYNLRSLRLLNSRLVSVLVVDPAHKIQNSGTLYQKQTGKQTITPLDRKVHFRSVAFMQSYCIKHKARRDQKFLSKNCAQCCQLDIKLLTW